MSADNKPPVSKKPDICDVLMASINMTNEQREYEKFLSLYTWAKNVAEAYDNAKLDYKSAEYWSKAAQYAKECLALVESKGE